MKETDVKSLTVNPFELFGDDWLALTAGNEHDGFNTMTVAWGHLGSLWERGTHSNRLPTATCFVRPSRYTKEFMDREELFTLSHFPKDYRRALGVLGSRSGRDGNKVEAAGLTPAFSHGTTYFAEADLVLICRKLYADELKEESFIDKGLVEFNYPQRDFHTMYIGEVIACLAKE